MNGREAWGWCIACWVLLGPGPAFAVAPVNPLWIPLGSLSSISADVQVMDRTASGLSVRVTVPGVTAGIHEDAAGRFTTLDLPDSGVLRAVGRPALPVIRRLMVVPENAGVECAVSGSLLPVSLPASRFPLQIMPVQPPIPKIPGAAEAAVFVQDTALYSSPSAYPLTPVTLTEAGTLFGRRLLALEVCPFAVMPATGGLAAYSNLMVTVTFTNVQVQAVEMGLTAGGRALLDGAVLNPPPAVEQMAATTKRLLVIAPESFTNGLAAFISHKTSRGWLVDSFGTNLTGTSSTLIQAFIKARYTNAAIRPDALLLVGDVAQIPCFKGVSADWPDTDLYYGCMDGVNDWQPEFPVGRFSVSSTSQLAAVVAKSIAHEQAPLSPWIKRATFLASWDQHAISEGTHNQVITNTMTSLGYSCEKLYSYTFGATLTQVRNALNNGCVLGVYSGHGDTTYWVDGPRFDQFDIARLTNAIYPVVFSFACLTGRYSYNECFAETWLRTSAKGAAAVLASSVNSYWDEDDILEKSLFTALFNENQPLLGVALWRARQLYLANLGVSDMTTAYFEQYNLLGDPTLEVAGLPQLSNGVPEAWFTSQGITNSNYALELNEDRDGDGMTAQQEYLAGTHPGDPASALRLVSERTSNGKVILRWLSAQTLFSPMAPYQIWARTNLCAGAWLLQTNFLVRTPPTNEVQFAIPPDSPQRFYRVTLTN